MQTEVVSGLDDIGGRIKAVRKSKGLKLTAVAKEIGVSRTAFTAWENNGIKRYDSDKLYGFAKLCDVSLDWLLERKGPDPDLAPPKRRSSKTRAAQAAMAERAKSANGSEQLLEVPVIEIAPSLAAHSNRLDLTPRNLWTIPHEILEIGFNADPEATVIKRIVTRSPDAFCLAKGDYVLIDYSRNRIDEPGTYLIEDPENKSAFRALVVLDQRGELALAQIADDLQRDGEQMTLDQLVPLGRVMGILKPA